MTKEQIKSLLTELVNDDELYAGGIANEKESLKHMTEKQSGTLQSKLYKVIEQLKKYK